MKEFLGPKENVLKDSPLHFLERACGSPGMMVVDSGLTATERALAQGVRVEDILESDVEKKIIDLFNQRKQEATSFITDYIGTPSWNSPFIYLYDEIQQCLLFGLSSASIITSGILLEFTLKYVVFIKENGIDVPFGSDVWGNFESRLMLGTAISKAKKLGLINEELESELRVFSKHVRNAYVHFNFQLITKNVKFTDVLLTDSETGNKASGSLTAAISPELQILAKNRLDKQNSLEIFRYVDSVVRLLLSQLDESERVKYSKAL